MRYDEPYKIEFWNEMILVSRLKVLKEEFLTHKKKETTINGKIHKWEAKIASLMDIEGLARSDIKVVKTQEIADKFKKEKKAMNKWLTTFWKRF